MPREPTLPEMLSTVKTLPADSLIFYVRYSPVTKGRVIYPGEMLPEIVRAAPVPIYCSLDMYLGTGVVGGVMRSGEATGARLGQLALKVLEGTAPESIPIESAQIKPMFDWRQLQRWRIDESQLPPGSEIRFRVPSAWEAGRLLHRRGDGGGDRPAAADRRVAAVARAPAPGRHHDPGAGSVPAHELRAHSADGGPADQRAGSGARRDRPRSARRRLPAVGLRVDGGRQPEERYPR